MARGHAVDFGNIAFRTKGEALAFLRAMLNRYRPGDTVSEVDGAILLGALQRHPDAAEKMGSGVAGFEVRAAEYGTQCFYIRRSDGTFERFSYKSCV